VLLALAALAGTAHAQVFRSIMPDGKIVYGSKPEPGAKESKQVDLPPPNIASPPPAAAPAKKPAGNAEGPAAKDGKGPGAIDVAAARQKLEAAQKALEDGREPREGERTGTATKGMTQLNEDYYKRIKTLEDAVTAAQTEYDTARQAAR
jgi:hypothetical protein